MHLDMSEVYERKSTVARKGLIQRDSGGILSVPHKYVAIAIETNYPAFIRNDTSSNYVSIGFWLREITIVGF